MHASMWPRLISRGRAGQASARPCGDRQMLQCGRGRSAAESNGIGRRSGVQKHDVASMWPRPIGRRKDGQPLDTADRPFPASMWPRRFPAAENEPWPRGCS